VSENAWRAACELLMMAELKWRAVFTLVWMVACLSLCSGRDVTMFSSIFGDDMILQRDAKAAVYGQLGTGDTSVTVRVYQESAKYFENTLLYSVDAQVDIEARTWKALLRPHNATGGLLYRVELESSSGMKADIEHVLFGDVYVCVGQSNMAMELRYTFQKDNLLKDFKQGDFDDSLRMLLFAGGQDRFLQAKTPQYVSTFLPKSKRWLIPSESTRFLSTYASTCLYFAHSFVKRNKEASSAVPIAVVAGAIGGTRIEAWVDLETTSKCTHTLATASDSVVPAASLYNGIISPMVNMTISGWLWYQGESNTVGEPGIGRERIGFGCQVVQLINKFRDIWSVVPGTTDELAYFGTVTLAAGTSLGHPGQVPRMRMAQSPRMGNVFVAQLYDAGEPWYSKKCQEAGCCPPSDFRGGTFTPAESCAHNPDWNASTIDGDWYNSSVPVFLPQAWGLHPRNKKRVGDRLAALLFGLTSQQEIISPYLEDCSVNEKLVSLTIRNGIDKLVYTSNANLTVKNRALQVCSEDLSICSCAKWNRINASAWECEKIVKKTAVKPPVEEPIDNPESKGGVRKPVNNASVEEPIDNPESKGGVRKPVNNASVEEPIDNPESKGGVRKPVDNASVEEPIDKTEKEDDGIKGTTKGDGVPGADPGLEKVATGEATSAGDSDKRDGKVRALVNSDENPGTKFWRTVDSLGLVESSNGTTRLEINLELLGLDHVYAVRFAWHDMPCCIPADSGLEPCPPANCGLLTAKNELAVEPFFVTFAQDGTCIRPPFMNLDNYVRP